MAPSKFACSVILGALLLWSYHHHSTLCNAVVFHVKPTEDSHCHHVPCFTLDTFVEKQSEYFISNATFVLLPGNHPLSVPLVVSNVSNLTLSGTQDSMVNNVSIVCNHSYLLFNHSINVTIQNLKLSSCGINSSMYGKSSGCYLPQYSFMNAASSYNCELMSTLSFDTVLNLNIVNIEVGYGPGISAINVLGNSFIDNAKFYGYGRSNTAEQRIPSVCVEFTSLLSATIPFYNHLRIQKSTFTYGQGPAIGAIFRQVHYKTYFDIDNMSTFQSQIGMCVLGDVQLHILTKEPELVHIILSNSFLSHSGGTAIAITGNAQLSNYYTHLSSREESFISTGDVTISSCEIVGYLHGGLVANEFVSVRLTIRDSLFASNKQFGMAPGVSLAGEYYNKQNRGRLIVLHNVTFMYNEAFPYAAVVSLSYLYNISLIDCYFVANKGTAVQIDYSTVQVQGTLEFRNNEAFQKGSLAFDGNSCLVMGNNTHILFQNNSATHVGGGIYVEGLPQTDQCFIQLSQEISLRSYPLENNSITFINNTSVSGGDSIYGAMIYKCITSLVTMSFGADLILGENPIFNFESTNTLSLISSDASRVCIFKDQQPQCTTLHVFETRYPGETFSLPAVAVGDMFGTVSGYVYAQFLFDSSSAALGDLQYFQQVVKCKCTELRFTVLSARQEEILVLTSDHVLVDADVERRFDVTRVESLINLYNDSGRILGELFTYPVYIIVTLIPCPLGFILSGQPAECVCHPQLQRHQISCNIDDQTVQRSGTVWVNASLHGNASNGIIIHTYCPYGYCKPEQISVNLQNPDAQCAFNHSGTLCGACQPGLSLALGTTQCLDCSNLYISFLLPFGIAGLALVFFIKILNLTVSQGTINGFILYANIVGSIQGTLLPSGDTNILTVFIAWLNLDLGVETCFSDGLNGYWKTWLQFVFPIYIWAIAGGIIVASHYSSTAVKIFGHNSVPVLATMFLLSYAKLLRTIITSLSFTFVEYPDGSAVAVWTFDANITYLSPIHTPLVVVALVFLIFLWLPFTVVLTFRQWLQQMSNYRVLRWVARLKPFFDAYHGPFMDKHRYWVGLILLLRVLLLLIFAVSPVTSSSFNLIVTVIAMFILLLYTTTVGHIYKRWYLTVLESSSIFNLGVLCAGTLYLQAAGGNQAIMMYISATFEFAKFILTVAVHVLGSIRSTRWLRNLMQKRARKTLVQHNQLQPGEGGIELSERVEEARQPVKHLRLTFDSLNEPLLVTATD